MIQILKTKIKKQELLRDFTTLVLAGVNNFKLGNNKVVCSDHFHHDCFNYVKEEVMKKYVNPSKCYLELLSGVVVTISSTMYIRANKHGQEKGNGIKTFLS